MHPRGPVSCGKTEYCVSNQQVMFHTRLKQQETIAITPAHSMFSYRTVPKSVIAAYSCIKVTKYDKLISGRNVGDDRVKVLVKLGFHFIRVSHCWGIAADDVEVFLPGQQRQSHRHESVIYALWRTSEFAY